MRLGGPVFKSINGPEDWAKAVREKGYRAAYCPVQPGAPATEVAAYEKAAKKAGIIISEVGIWKNTLSPDPKERKMALEHSKACLFLADSIGAVCAVNISGSRGPKWDGPYAPDLDETTFQMIVETTREIIDSVKPVRAVFTIETMPWMVPDSAESYLELIRAVDRPSLGAHFDPVNMINCPRRYFDNAEFVRDFVECLGPYIKSCHAKDILLGDRLTVHLEEVRPGTGGLDYASFLKAVNSLGPEIPLMLEHLDTESDYDKAAGHIRQTAKAASIIL